jgi:DNA-binding protein HU-beta
MNKADLVQALTERLDTDRRVAAAALDGVLDVIMETVASGDSVTILGFGTFERRERAARSGRNPRTGAVIEIPAASVPGFRAGANFRNVVSGVKEVAPRRASQAPAAARPSSSAVSALDAVAAVPASAPAPETVLTNGAAKVAKKPKAEEKPKAEDKKAEDKKVKPAKAAPKKSDAAKSGSGKAGKKKSKK